MTDRESKAQETVPATGTVQEQLNKAQIEQKKLWHEQHRLNTKRQWLDKYVNDFGKTPADDENTNRTTSLKKLSDFIPLYDAQAKALDDQLQNVSKKMKTVAENITKLQNNLRASVKEKTVKELELKLKEKGLRDEQNRLSTQRQALDKYMNGIVTAPAKKQEFLAFFKEYDLQAEKLDDPLRKVSEELKTVAAEITALQKKPPASASTSQETCAATETVQELNKTLNEKQIKQKKLRDEQDRLNTHRQALDKYMKNIEKTPADDEETTGTFGDKIKGFFDFYDSQAVKLDGDLQNVSKDMRTVAEEIKAMQEKLRSSDTEKVQEQEKELEKKLSEQEKLRHEQHRLNTKRQVLDKCLNNNVKTPVDKQELEDFFQGYDSKAIDLDDELRKVSEQMKTVEAAITALKEELQASGMANAPDVLAWHDLYMSFAKVASMRSQDRQTQVGACIVDHKGDNEKRRGKIVGIGYNGFPVGTSNDGRRWKKDAKHDYVVHAEENALLFKSVADVTGCTMYVTLFPCNKCAQAIIQSGIKLVVYVMDTKHYNKSISDISRQMFDEADVKYEKYKPKREDPMTIDLKFPERQVPQQAPEGQETEESPKKKIKQ